jgi:hypothetical protein
MGVRNHTGRIIRSNKKKTIIPAETFFESRCLFMKSKIGVKIKARIKAITIEIKIGLRTRIDKATKKPRRITVAVFLTIGSCILYQFKP